MTVDWPRVMRDLKGFGYSYRGLQAQAGIHKDRCHHIANGAEPAYSEGMALLDLLKRCQDAGAVASGIAA